ncbi:MAG: MFS transporter [Candidatus Zixiibacteriota bacterium]|mgnify:CR=1 FL=1
MLNDIIATLRGMSRDVWILCLGWFVSALGFAASMPFISIYFHREYGMTVGEIGLFFGAMAIVRASSQAFAGEMSDRLPRRSILIHSQTLRAVAFALLASVVFLKGGLGWMAVGLFFNFILGAIFQPVANAMISDFLPPEKRIDGFALIRAAGNMGWAAGPALGGWLAASSYGLLFIVSAILTLTSAIIVMAFLGNPPTITATDRFKMTDLLAIRNDKLLARHCLLILALYLVVAQLIVPFSLYATQTVGLSETELGYLFGINGLIVVALQIPITKLLAKTRLTTQLVIGSLFYFVGYSAIGFLSSFWMFACAIVTITIGENVMSPPSLALTARLAPAGRMGRYMGIFAFFVTAGWSLGPLYGGQILEHFGDSPRLAWIVLASLSLVSAGGYLLFRRPLPATLDNGSAV